MANEAPSATATGEGAANLMSSAGPQAAPVPVPPPQSQAAEPSNAQYRPLNVRDALSYLDQVKIQFQDQPDVYNRFLDVMKEFKGQIIDTPGVIDRVSSLFRGHPSLIQGFNTFLPPGYRIECLGGEGDVSGLITVITPTGTVSQVAGGFSAGLAAVAAQAQADAANKPPAAGPSRPLGPSYTNPSFAQYYTPEGQALQAQQRAEKEAAASAAGTPQAAASGSKSPPPAAGGPAFRQTPQLEFNHAINYVNKIKNRFASDPDTYKQFLEILQTYQKEQRPIQDVYAQVTILFKPAPDLLDEFKQFLPDTSNGAAPTGSLFGGLIGQMANDMMGPGATTANKNGDRNALDKAAKNAATGGAGRGQQADKKGDPKGKEAEAAASKKKRGPEVKDKGVVPQKPKKSKHHHKGEVSPEPEPHSSHAPHQPSYSSTHNAGGSLASPDEIAFFERVKKFIEDKNTYHEFLKLLNLFVQDIIDSKVLVERAHLFIGESGDIWNQFRVLVGDDQAGRGGSSGIGGQYGLNGSGGILGAGAGLDGVVENNTAVDRPKVDLNSCKAYGASYRKLPKSEVNLSCSGRDPMCWDVLNDEWVSHPTSASEDAAPFIAHKKNIYEESLHRAEEERHEYDYHIEANLRTIALLEPIAARIALMTADEKMGFRLKPGLGGQSKSIYQRIIKKIYGRESGLEVIGALHENPTVAVPVVLARLKQKDEEWKRAQREWNKVWREVDAKNFYKSLDHQGVTFKTNDKKAITSKSLVSEIEALRREQIQRRDAVVDATLAAKPKYQYAFKFDDVDCLQDSIKLVFSYLDRAPGSLSSSDRERVESFLRNFVPTFFMFPIDEFDAAFVIPGEGLNGDGMDGDESEMDAMSDGASETGDDDGASNGSTKRAKKSAGDLRKKVLKGAVGGGVGRAGSSTPGPAAASPSSMAEDSPAPEASGSASGVVAADESASEMDVDVAAPGLTAPESPDLTSLAPTIENAEKTWISVDDAAGSEYSNSRATSPAGSSTAGDGPSRPKRKANFFANAPLYVLFRLLQMLYNRLSTLKEISRKQAQQSPSMQLINPLAIELGLNDVGGPSPLLMEGVNPSAHFYEHLLDLCEKLFDNEIDQLAFEENMRHMYGTKAFISFTLDKLIAGIVKQVQTVMTDGKSQDLLGLLANDRALEATTARQQISYRMGAEAVLGPDENLYRMEWVDESKSLLIQLLGKDDLTLDDAITAEQKWKAYLASYILTHPTEGLPAKVRPPFLRRTMATDLPASSSSPSSSSAAAPAPPAPISFIAESGLEIKVCIGSYKLFFVPDTEDFFSRRLTVEDEEKREEAVRERTKEGAEKMAKWVEGKLGLNGEKEKVVQEEEESEMMDVVEEKAEEEPKVVEAEREAEPAAAAPVVAEEATPAPAPAAADTGSVPAAEPVAAPAVSAPPATDEPAPAAASTETAAPATPAA